MRLALVYSFSRPWKIKFVLCNSICLFFSTYSLVWGKGWLSLAATSWLQTLYIILKFASYSLVLNTQMQSHLQGPWSIKVLKVPCPSIYFSSLLHIRIIDDSFSLWINYIQQTIIRAHYLARNGNRIPAMETSLPLATLPLVICSHSPNFLFIFFLYRALGEKRVNDL